MDESLNYEIRKKLAFMAWIYIRTGIALKQLSYQKDGYWEARGGWIWFDPEVQKLWELWQEHGSPE